MTETKRHYAEVHNHHVETVDDVHGIELENVVAVVIDGYKTDDENEEGNAIAKVFGIKQKEDVRVFVEYYAVEARYDEMAQESIREAVNRIPALLNQEESGEIR